MKRRQQRRGGNRWARAGLLVVWLPLACGTLVGLDGEFSTEPARAGGGGSGTEPDSAIAGVGAQGGLSGASGSGGIAGAAGDPGDGAVDSSGGGSGGVVCPTCGAKPGTSPMLRLQAGGRTFCMDEHEVTVGEYAAMLASPPDVSPAGQPLFLHACLTFPPPILDATGLEPEQWATQLTDPSAPVTRVDWCQANIYCRWAGKRLCSGAPDGTYGDGLAFLNPAASEWQAACAADTAQGYPYGPAYAPVCNDSMAGVGGPAPTSLHPSCGEECQPKGLSGNVAEWESMCVLVLPGAWDCHIRGGSYIDGAPALRCDAGRTGRAKQRFADVGFRCCGP